MTDVQELARRRRRREENRPIIAALRASTPCANCGAVGSVDYHSEDHHERPHRRIGDMVSGGYTLASIKAEIARCTPLCRRCHMLRDGRLEKFIAGTSAAGRARWA